MMTIENWHLLTLAGMGFMILEIVAPGFILMPIGLGFLVTALASLWISDDTTLLLVLGANVLICLFVVRRFFQRDPNPPLATGADDMVGKRAVVTEAIAADGQSGYVKLYGDTWRAIGPQGSTIAKGQTVTITAIDGNKVIVAPTEP